MLYKSISFLFKGLLRPFLVSFICSSCVSVDIPLKEYTIARAAYDAALAAESSKYAPKYFYKAKSLYMEAERNYKERYYGKAKEQFKLSIKYAQKAESLSRVKQFQTGDMDGF